MNYTSTRGALDSARFTEVVLEGLAPDGGLVVPVTIPHIDESHLETWRYLTYPDLAVEVMSRFVDDISLQDLRRLARMTYSVETFGSIDVAPLSRLSEDLYLLELSNGPTLAFKDIAMQWLGHLFEYVLSRSGRELNILGATSGDTGSAAEYAMKGRRGVRVFMLSPRGKMSPFQTAQMYSLTDANIFNIAIDGVFDDCQDIVKSISADAAFKRQFHIGAVNSINWARIAAQVVYYFKGYFGATADDGQEVSFAVPSGNFGNVLAGHVARQMGLPIRRLIVATNENDVLDEFFRTGRYRVRSAAETRQTSSPSMDISKASNFERFVFDLAERDPAAIAALWYDVEHDGGFDLAGTPLGRRLHDSGFVSGRSTHADRIETIRSLAKRHDVVIDPHTADGVKVGLEHREKGVPLICIETALPVKFAATIQEALGYAPPRPAAYEGLEALPQRFVTLPADAAAVRTFVAEHAHA
jgi:threonine synthase